MGKWTDDVPPPLPGQHGPITKSFIRYSPTRPIWRYVLRLGVIALLGGVFVSIALGPILGGEDMREATMGLSPWFFALVALLIAPPIETLVLAAFIGITRLFTHNVYWAAVISAIFWGALHLGNSPLNGVAVIWPFYVMSRAYLAWRPTGFWKAVGVTTLIHATINVVPAMLVLLMADTFTTPPTIPNEFSI